MKQQKNGPVVDLPQHVNPTRADRFASAPYNFVPLPEVVVTAASAPEDLPSHDVYASAASGGESDSAYINTGYFDVELTTLSPLYVRCGLTRAQYARQERHRRQGQRGDQRRSNEQSERDEQDVPFRERVKNRPEFYYTADPAQPVIPGSSLRGMLRGVLEIASYGKVGRVTNKRLFFRSVDNTSLGVAYRDRMVGTERFGNKVEGGFLTRRESEDAVGVIAICQVLRIPRPLAARIGNGRLPNRANDTPDWHQQYHRVWVNPPSGGVLLTERDVWMGQGKPAVPGDWREGVLVITGASPGKKKEFVFLLPDANAEKVSIPRGRDNLDQQNLIERFHDDDQITQWQERAFPMNKPEEGCRERPGLLRTRPSDPGDPVFFLREAVGKGSERELTFFGRAQMFRLPYRHTPLDLVPTELRSEAGVDYVEALFGYVRDREDRSGSSSNVRQGEKGRAYAGRISVGDANLVAGQGNVLAAQPIVPPILATPKPTAFQHYLVQQQSDPNRLSHFDTPGATLRGHKRYWHQGRRTLGDIALTEEQLRAVPPASAQHTQCRPVLPWTRFLFRVHFENLSRRELGALCWALHPRGPEGVEYAHSLGMGKPLGMGGVRLHATLHLTDRAKRYGRLFAADGSWETGEDTPPVDLSDHAALATYTEAFEQHVLDEIGLAGEASHGLYDVKRIAMLLRLMEWPGVRPQPPAPSNPANRQNRQGNVRTMCLDLPGVTDPREKNEFRSRPVLPDPSAFDRPLSGDLEPRRVAIRGDGHGEPSRTPATEAARATSGRMTEEAMAQRVETLRQRMTEQPATPRFKRGDVVEAEVLHLNKARGTIKVRLRQNGQEPPAIKNVSVVLMDDLDQGSTIFCRIEEVDQKSSYVQRVSWKWQR